MTIAIIDAYDSRNAEGDLATFSTQFGSPACTSANGCFQKVNQTEGSILLQRNTAPIKVVGTAFMEQPCRAALRRIHRHGEWNARAVSHVGAQRFVHRRSRRSHILRLSQRFS